MLWFKVSRLSTEFQLQADPFEEIPNNYYDKSTESTGPNSKMTTTNSRTELVGVTCSCKLSPGTALRSEVGNLKCTI